MVEKLNKEKALEIAKKFRNDLNCYTEYADAFIFGNNDDDSLGGKSEPVVILRSTGRAISMVEYCDMPSCGDAISEGSI